MKVIISPAKKMKDHEDGFEYKDLPVFLNKTEILLERLQKMELLEIQKTMKCNEKIALLNYDRFHHMNLKENLVPALFTYEGLQYQHLSPNVFTEDELDYIQKHLRILSGFYGVLRPFDGIRCYRLEMQTKFDVDGKMNLYDFWGSDIAHELYKDNEIILNLASKEYSQCVEKYLYENRKMITCQFKVMKDGKFIVKGTEAKMARGEMVRFMAMNSIEDINEIKKFNLLGYKFNELRSSEDEFIFIKEDSYSS